MKTFKKEAEKLNLKHQVRSLKAEQTRARSINVGTAFGGSTEISMRSQDSKHLWVIMQPVEVIELINQLAANIGCHIIIKPRKDFASWRQWNNNIDEEEQQMMTHGKMLTPPEQQPGMLPPPKQSALNIERKENEPVAIKKTVNRRSTKRASATS